MLLWLWDLVGVLVLGGLSGAGAPGAVYRPDEHYPAIADVWRVLTGKHE